MGKLKKVSLEEARAQFEQLLEELLAGKSVLVTRKGKSSVEISASRKPLETKQVVPPGKFVGQIQVNEGFDDWTEEIAQQLGIDF